MLIMLGKFLLLTSFSPFHAIIRYFYKISLLTVINFSMFTIYLFLKIIVTNLRPENINELPAATFELLLDKSP